MAKPKITLYVDLVSPFGFLAYWFLRNSPVFQQCDITYVPILLGGVMKACGNNPPLNIKNKDKWSSKEKDRWAQQFNIPLRRDIPAGFPMNTVTVERALCAIELQAPEKLPVALDALMAAVWAPDTLKEAPSPRATDYDIKNPEALGALLSPASVLGAELTKSVLQSIGSPEAKSQLSKNTDDALKSGAFGLPWFVCTNTNGDVEGFWGFDHLGQVVKFLGIDGSNQLRPML